MKRESVRAIVFATFVATVVIGAKTSWGWGYSTPNPMGGMNYFSNGRMSGYSTPNPMGGMNFFSNGRMSGYSTPNPMGGMNFHSFRGKDSASTLFADNVFNQKIEVEKIAVALENRDVDTLTSCAWDLKGLEKILGKKDKRTCSDALFAAAAQLAVEQGNADGLKAIMALTPECKKYQDALAIKGETRGVGVISTCAMPQVVHIDSDDWKEQFEKLKVWQTPKLDGVKLCGSFRGITKTDAELCSAMVNGGRSALCPLALATGAIRLSAFSPVDGCSEKILPITIFKEAAELAIYKGDTATVKQLLGLFKTSAISNPEYAKYLNEMASIGGAPRGSYWEDSDGINPDGREAVRMIDRLIHKMDK